MTACGSASSPRRDPAPLVLVGVSGPDGAGKSGLVRGLRATLEAEGARVGTAYVYGCLVCRRLPARAGEVVTEASASGRYGGLGRHLARLLRGLHGLVDAAELWVRLSLAASAVRAAPFRLTARRPGPTRGSTARYLITDRSPLDGLAKHDPAPGSHVERLYRRLVSRYDVIVLLAAPPETLAARDGEHDAASLAEVSAGFDRQASRLPRVVRLDTGGREAADVLAVAWRRVAPAAHPHRDW